MAVDSQGPSVVEPYAGDKSFLTLVDTENKLGQYFGFKVVPNGIFLDENGVIRLFKQDFRVAEPTHVDAVTKLANGVVAELELDDTYYEPPTNISSLEQQLADTKFKLATEYIRQEKTDMALQELDEAIRLDPDNFLVRKQRWYLRYPEKFVPTIDIEWQQHQLEQERAEEAVLRGMACGPEGCVIPGTTFTVKRD